MQRDFVIRAMPPALARELQVAKSEHQQGQYDTARRRYQRILKHKPQLTEALHYLGVLEHMDGNSEAGLTLVQQAYEQRPGDHDIRKNLSNMLNDLNRVAEAEPLYRQLLVEHPADPGNHSNHCVALRKLGRFDEAVAAGRQAVTLAPRDAAARLALANALGAAGELEQAAHAYEQVLAQKPTFSPAHDSLCRILLQIEQSGPIARFRLRRTRQAYQRWVEAVPDNPTASFLLNALERHKVPARMPDAVVKSSFDAYADSFDKHIRSLHYRAPELIGEVLVRRLPAPAATLDILDGGCGTGLAAPLLRPYARQLTGIDLSSAMLDRARATGCYDTLAEVELGAFLQNHAGAFDVCVFIDVLSYFGDLHAIFQATARALRPGALLAFTVEKSSRAGSHLNPTGRFSHHCAHVRAALAAAGMVATEEHEAPLRNESNAPVVGLIVSARTDDGRTASGASTC